MAIESQVLTTLMGVIIGGMIALSVNIVFDHYRRTVERRRYAAALSHEIRRISEKLEQRASSLESVKKDYDEEKIGFPYGDPDEVPIDENDFLVHRSTVGLIGRLDYTLAKKVLDFYDKVKDLQWSENKLYDVYGAPEVFDHWISDRRKLAKSGFSCSNDLDNVSKKRLFPKSEN